MSDGGGSGGSLDGRHWLLDWVALPRMEVRQPGPASPTHGVGLGGHRCWFHVGDWSACRPVIAVALRKKKKVSVFSSEVVPMGILLVSAIVL